MKYRTSVADKKKRSGLPGPRRKRARRRRTPGLGASFDVHALIFDRSGKIRRPPLWRLLGEFRAFLLDPRSVAPGLEMSRGDGHPVLVFPPFLYGDAMTRPLRRFLDACGYAAYGWGLGRNLGPSNALIEGTARLVAKTYAIHRRKVSIIGISLGGIMAREAAKRHPDCVRRVITLCSPFRLPTATNIEPLFWFLAAPHSEDFTPFLRGLGDPPPVPTTALYTKSDGIVAWQSCLNPKSALAENVEVTGAHSTIGRNPQALAILLERLARPERV